MASVERNTSLPASSNPVLKFLLGIFNFFVPFIALSSFAFAIVLGLALLFNPLEFLPIELVLIVVALFSTTYAARHNAFEAQKKARETIQMQQAAGTEIAPDDQKAADAIIPGFGALLKRNAVVAVFYAPVAAIVSLIAFGLIFGIINFARGTAENRFVFEIVLRCPLLFVLYGWFYGVFFSLRRVSRFVDNRVLHVTIDLPEDEETRNKRRMREAMQGEMKEVGMFKSIKSGFVGIAGGLLFNFFIATLPVIVVLWGIQQVSLPDSIKLAVTAVLVLGYLFFLIIMTPRLLSRSRDRFISRQFDLMAKEAKTAENSAEIFQEVEAAKAEFERRSKTHENSIENRVTQRMFTWFFGFAGGFLIAGVLLSILARSLGATGDTPKTIMVVVWGGGILLFFVFGNKILNSSMPKSELEKISAAYEAAMRSGDYENLIIMVDKVMEKLPNWETKIPAAAAYAQVARFDDAERLVRETLQELSQADSDAQREMYKSIMGDVFGLLAEIYFAQQRYDEAEKYLQRAIEFGDDGYPINNTVAKFNLYRGQAEAALKHINQAAKKYAEAKQPVSAYNIVLRAWASAIQGDNARADQLMKDALEQVEPKHHADMAEIYLLGGYMMHVQGNKKAEAHAYQKAVELDSQGISGYVARRELEKFFPS